MSPQLGPLAELRLPRLGAQVLRNQPIFFCGLLAQRAVAPLLPLLLLLRVLRPGLQTVHDFGHTVWIALVVQLLTHRVALLLPQRVLLGLATQDRPLVRLHQQLWLLPARGFLAG